MQMDSDSDSEPELPLNQGNGDMVEESDELAHIHEKCDNLMAQLKALNQAAVNMSTASAVSTSPFVTPPNVIVNPSPTGQPFMTLVCDYIILCSFLM